MAPPPHSYTSLSLYKCVYICIYIPELRSSFLYPMHMSREKLSSIRQPTLLHFRCYSIRHANAYTRNDLVLLHARFSSSLCHMHQVPPTRPGTDGRVKLKFARQLLGDDNTKSFRSTTFIRKKPVCFYLCYFQRRYENSYSKREQL